MFKLVKLQHCIGTHLQDVAKHQLLPQSSDSIFRSSPGVNFINVLQPAFMREDPERAKKIQSSFQSFFVFSRSGCEKAAYRILMKLTPGVNFISICCARFLYESKLSSFSLTTFVFVIFGAKILYEKCACKTLM
jgi:hypothetical protein